MRRKLYFGDLWFEATQTELRDWFGHFGSVEAVTISQDAEPDTTDEKGLERVDHGCGIVELGVLRFPVAVGDAEE